MFIDAYCNLWFQSEIVFYADKNNEKLDVAATDILLPTYGKYSEYNVRN